jgi:transcriptional regulator NrdR family protein
VDLKSLIKQQRQKLLQDPRVAALMQDERVIKGMMKALQMRQQAQQRLEQRVEELAGSLNIATKNELQELKRTLRKMEKELQKAKSEVEAAKKALTKSGE